MCMDFTERLQHELDYDCWLRGRLGPPVALLCPVCRAEVMVLDA